MNMLLLWQRIVVGAILVGIGYLIFRLAIAPTHHTARPIKLAALTWEPYVDPHLEGGGPIGRIVTETLRRMNYEPQLVFLSSALAQEQTLNGQAFGTFPWIETEARKSRYRISDSILDWEYVLFFHKGHTPRDSIENIKKRADLANYRLGIVKGYEMWDSLTLDDSFFKDVDSSFFTSTEAFRALLAGSVDFVPEGRIAGLTIIQGPDFRGDANKFGILDSRDNPSFGSTVGAHLLVPKSRENIMADFDSLLAVVKETSLYRDAEEQIRCALFPVEEVELQSTSEGSVNVVEAGDEAVQFAVPIGTRAVVLAWPSSFMPQSEDPADEPSRCEAKSLNGSQDEAPTDEPPRYKVKLLNGPHRGRVVYVDARSVTLTR